MTRCYFFTQLLLFPGFLAASWNSPAHHPPWSRWGGDYLQCPSPFFPEATPHPFLKLPDPDMVELCRGGRMLRSPICLPCGNCPSPSPPRPPISSKGGKRHPGEGGAVVLQPWLHLRSRDSSPQAFLGGRDRGEGAKGR